MSATLMSEADAAASKAEEEEDGEAEMTIPRYCMPNYASILPGYTNQDSEHIAQAFRAGNWVSLSTVPANLRPAAVARAKQEIAALNLRSSPERGKGATTSNGLFTEFEYIPSRYSLADELATKERLESEAKRLAVGGKDFIPSSQVAKLKHEDGFEDKEYRFPYLGDPYAASRDQVMRAKWVEDSKILHGPFVPSGLEKVGSKPTRKALPAILKELHTAVNADWGDYRFAVLSTEDDAVVVRFEMASVDSERGLQAYMNVMARSGDVVMKYQLKKVVEDWHSRPGDGFLYYMFRPPWVRARATDTFFTLHPEERNFATSLAATLKPEHQVMKDRASRASLNASKKAGSRDGSKASRSSLGRAGQLHLSLPT